MTISMTHKILMGILLALVVAVPLMAQEFTQGFAADEKLLRGSIVSRIEGDETKVEGASLDSVEQIYGVVVRSNETAVSLTVDPAGVLVATSGRFEMLVSNINGDVKEGDYLTASSIRGIAMKADDRQSKTLGQALQDFDVENPNQVLATRNVTANDGQNLTVGIGRVLADLDVRNNPLAYGVQAPEVLIRLGETIAGGPVSVTRIWGALSVLVLSFATGSVIFYAGIRTSIIAIGRNPLSKASVLRGFLQVTAISLAIFIIGGFAVYLILKL
jgi:hypothetical protein